MNHDEVPRGNFMKRHHRLNRVTGSVHKARECGQTHRQPRGVSDARRHPMAFELGKTHTRTVCAPGDDPVANIVARSLVLRAGITQPHNEPLGP